MWYTLIYIILIQMNNIDCNNNTTYNNNNYLLLLLLLLFVFYRLCWNIHFPNLTFEGLIKFYLSIYLFYILKVKSFMNVVIALKYKQLTSFESVTLVDTGVWRCVEALVEADASLMRCKGAMTGRRLASHLPQGSSTHPFVYTSRSVKSRQSVHSEAAGAAVLLT